MTAFDKLPLVVNGKTVVFPCVEIMALSKTAKVDGAEGYVRFYEAFAKRYGEQLRYYQLNDSTRWKKVLPKDLGKVTGWFSDVRSLAEPLLGILMHGHEVAGEPQPPLFDMMFDHAYPEYPRGMFRIVLPVDAAADGAEALLELVDEAMMEFPVHWGTVGYSFYWDSADTTIDGYAQQWLRRHLEKHPGLSPGTLMTFGLRVEQGVLNVGWLTFVGDELLAQLGGRDVLTSRARDARIGVRPYAKGVALQTGPVPELGDVNRKKRLEQYHEVGRLLGPVFAPEAVRQRFRVKGYDDRDEATAWIERFLP